MIKRVLRPAGYALNKAFPADCFHQQGQLLAYFLMVWFLQFPYSLMENDSCINTSGYRNLKPEST